MKAYTVWPWFVVNGIEVGGRVHPMIQAGDGVIPVYFRGEGRDEWLRAGSARIENVNVRLVGDCPSLVESGVGEDSHLSFVVFRRFPWEPSCFPDGTIIVGKGRYEVAVILIHPAVVRMGAREYFVNKDGIVERSGGLRWMPSVCREAIEVAQGA